MKSLKQKNEGWLEISKMDIRHFMVIVTNLWGIFKVYVMISDNWNVCIHIFGSSWLHETCIHCD